MKVNKSLINPMWYITAVASIWGSALGGITIPGMGLVTPYRFFSVILLAILLLSSKEQDWTIDKRLLRTVLPIAAAMTLLAFISLVWSDDKGKTAKAAINFVFVIIFLVLFFRMSKDRKVFYNTLIILSANFSLVLLWGIYEIFTANYILSEMGPAFFISRWNPFGLRYPLACFYNTNDFAMNIVIFTPVILFTVDELLHIRKAYKILCSTFVLLISYFVLLNTSSRAGFIAFPIVVGIYLIIQIKKSKLNAAFFVIMTVIMALIQTGIVNIDFGVKGPPPITDKIVGFFDSDVSSNSRMDVLTEGLRIIKDTYGMGAGAKNSPAFMKTYTDFPESKYSVKDYHFFYLELAAEYGVIIFIWIIAFQGLACLAAIRELRNKMSGEDRQLAVLSLPINIGIVLTSICSSSCMFFYSVWLVFAICSLLLYDLHMAKREKS